MNRINQFVIIDEWRMAFSLSNKEFYGNINRNRRDLIESYGLRDAIRHVGPRRRAMEAQVTRYYSDGCRLIDIREWEEEE